MSALTDSPAWKALTQHHAAMRETHVRDLFARDDHRFERTCSSTSPSTASRPTR